MGRMLRMFAGAHYKMERFCVMFTALFLAMLIILLNCFRINYKNAQLNLGTKAVWTSSAQFSLSETYINVENVYRNSTFTKAFVLLKAEDNGMRTLSTDAKDYQMFMTAAEKKSPLTCSPTGAIYVFGNTGMIGLYFADEKGFDPNLYDIVLRNTRMMVQPNTAKADAVFRDKSYVKNNQMHFYVNLAGSDAPIADFLEQDDPQVRDIYIDLVSTSKDAEIKQGLNEALLEMNVTMAQINEYANRLSNTYRLAVPALPVSIDGDYVTTQADLTAGNPNVFTSNMLRRTGTTAVYSPYTVTVDSSDATVYQDFVNGDDLYLVTDFVFPGGVQFDYQSASLREGIVEAFKDPALTYDQWLTHQRNEEAQYSRAEVGANWGKWMYKDGKEFVGSSYDDTLHAISADISQYQAAVDKLVGLKSTYQKKQLYDLLALDTSSKSIAQMFSIRSDAETVVLW